ncbi:MAG: hypothetical protein IJI25_05870 [Eubacterium sp.]|nr:hypothetical protein [Eubacterium sp.]
MYSDSQSKKSILLILFVVFILAAIMISFFYGKDPGRDLSEESAVAIENAVARSALQCYVVEGVYPPDLSYLEDNYGLQVNKKDFYVRYDAFASNIPPSIKVINKH